jgi:predicted nucleotidyltransferase
MLSNIEIKKRLLKDEDIKKLGINFKNKKYTKKDVKKAINVELEHKDLTKGDLKKTWKIARAHLEENPNYYDMLEILEDPKNYSKIMAMRPSCCDGGCYACGGNLNIVMQKNRNSITDQIKDMIKLISKNKNKSEIFGSYVYRSQFYPSDIDIHEVIRTTPTRPESIYKSAAKALQNIVKDVKKRRGIYYGEVKAGIDERFLIDINDKN